MTEPGERPEGALIERARKQLRPKLSQRKAAAEAGISEGRWRQITKGYQGTGGGRLPVVGPAETVANMARVVQVTADEMRAAGRPDAAAHLERVEGSANPRVYGDDLEIRAVFAEMADFFGGPYRGDFEYPPSGGLQVFSDEQIAEESRRRIIDLSRRWEGLFVERQELEERLERLTGTGSTSEADTAETPADVLGEGEPRSHRPTQSPDEPSRGP